MYCIVPLQVLVADINIGYEDIVNTQVMKDSLSVLLALFSLAIFSVDMLFCLQDNILHYLN